MKIDVTPEEWMRMQDDLVKAKVENALLRDQLKLTASERDRYHAQMIAAKLEELMQLRDAGKVVPLVLSKLPAVLKGLDNMDQVRLVMYTLLQMLPDNAPAEMVKMVTDAVPRKVNGQPLVQIGMDKAGDIIGQGGTKNVNNYGQEPEKGENAV